jgi:hypothetical protein
MGAVQMIGTPGHQDVVPIQLSLPRHFLVVTAMVCQKNQLVTNNLISELEFLWVSFKGPTQFVTNQLVPNQ